MKLFRLAAVIALWCATAFGQASVQCTSFPCVVQVTAVQCASFPCALTITTIPLPAVGVAPASLAFSAPLNTDSTVQVELINNASTSTLPLTWAVAGAGFSDAKVGSCRNGQITHGKCGISVKYHPTVAAFPPVNATGTLTVNAGTPSLTTVVNLTGNTTGTAPGLTVTPASLSFTAAPNTDSAIQFVTITNSGAAGVPQVSALSLPFAYAGKGTCGSTYNPGQSCTISVLYHPTGAGPDSGTVTIAAGVTAVPLSGTVVVPVTKTVQLQWNAPVSDGAASYNLYRSSGSSGLVKVGNVVGSVLTFTDAAVPSGTYQYAATTVDSSGRESIDSNLITVTIP